MHAPERIEPTGLSDYLAVMSRSVFEPGLNWQVVESKWPGIVEAFEGFDPMRVAAYTPEDVDRLLGDPGVIRNRAEIEAVVHNAGEMLALAETTCVPKAPTTNSRRTSRSGSSSSETWAPTTSFTLLGSRSRRGSSGSMRIPRPTRGGSLTSGDRQPRPSVCDRT